MKVSFVFASFWNQIYSDYSSTFSLLSSFHKQGKTSNKIRKLAKTCEMHLGLCTRRTERQLEHHCQTISEAEGPWFVSEVRTHEKGHK